MPDKILKKQIGNDVVLIKYKDMYDGTFAEIVSSNISSSDIFNIVKGNIPGHKIMRGMGERDNIQTTATGEDLWRGNELSNTPSALASHTKIPTPSSSGEQMSIISESNADNGATATGILTIMISYLDVLCNEKITTVTMNGTTTVDLEPSDIRFIQDIQALTVGSNGAAEGHIRIYKKSNATLVYSMIASGGNQSLIPNKMVPLGKTLYLQKWISSESSLQKGCRVRLRSDCNNTIPPRRQEGVFLFKSVMALNSSVGPFDLAYSIPALSIVKVSGFADNVNAELGVHWWGILVDEEI